MDVHIGGQSLVSVNIGYTVNFVMTGNCGFRADKALTLALPGARQCVLDPEHQSGIELEPIRQLVGHSVRTATAAANGALHVVFDNGAFIHVEPDDCYESWCFYTPMGSTIVCLPGGAYGVWSAER